MLNIFKSKEKKVTICQELNEIHSVKPNIYIPNTLFKSPLLFYLKFKFHKSHWKRQPRIRYLSQPQYLSQKSTGKRLNRPTLISLHFFPANVLFDLEKANSKRRLRGSVRNYSFPALFQFVTPKGHAGRPILFNLRAISFFRPLITLLIIESVFRHF